MHTLWLEGMDGGSKSRGVGGRPRLGRIDGCCEGGLEQLRDGGRDCTIVREGWKRE